MVKVKVYRFGKLLKEQDCEYYEPFSTNDLVCKFNSFRKGTCKIEPVSKDYGNSFWCKVASNGITNPQEIPVTTTFDSISLNWEDIEGLEKLIKIPEGRKRITFKVKESGFLDMQMCGMLPSWFTYFRKPRSECAMDCNWCGGVQDVRKIAWGKEPKELYRFSMSCTIYQCEICGNQLITG